jgi:hypothetical protein
MRLRHRPAAKPRSGRTRCLPGHRRRAESSGTRRSVDVVFTVRSRAIGAIFDELVAFFRPTYSHVREEKQRLDLIREEEGEAAPPLRIGETEVRMSLPQGYEPPSGPRRPTEEPPDSRGIVV